jgi:hypothetical protein
MLMKKFLEIENSREITMFDYERFPKREIGFWVKFDVNNVKNLRRLRKYSSKFLLDFSPSF